MTIQFLSIFPDFFTSTLSTSILKRAQEKQLVKFEIINIRDFATDKHRITDDKPYGGGPGMVMKIEPIDGALESLKNSPTPKKTILTSAKGKLFTQSLALAYSQLETLQIICGHYEGVDERVAEHLIDEEVSIGEFVLTGGEAASLVIADAVTRLVPGVLGNEASNKNESHSAGIKFAAPVYTTPQAYRGWLVPEVLTSGHHDNIKKWQTKQRQAQP